MVIATAIEMTNEIEIALAIEMMPVSRFQFGS